MSKKSLIWLGIFIGSTAGAYAPALWGGSLLSGSSILFSTLGAFVGIWAGYRLGGDE
ncbi:hypothetical protein IPJ72_02155 [Candidatus Peregrinibacteria bacterium]|nr:MAG: hypothetical protein IPJ72_02155 [Candidatus Peregrinibacteria bacterium]